MITNTPSLGVHDPERRAHPLHGQRPHRRIETLEDRTNRLIARTQHEDAGGPTGIVPARIGEVHVEREQHPILGLAGNVERHPHGYAGMGTIRSCASAAANPSAAGTCSGRNPG